MRLIYADELEKAVEKYFDGLPIQGRYDILAIIANAPTVDVVEVVRCKDCEFYYDEEKWCRRLGLCGAFYGDGFCCHGERRDDDKRSAEKGI